MVSAESLYIFPDRWSCCNQCLFTYEIRPLHISYLSNFYADFYISKIICKFLCRHEGKDYCCVRALLSFTAITVKILLQLGAHAEVVRRGSQVSVPDMGFSARYVPCMGPSNQSQLSAVTCDSQQPGLRWPLCSIFEC